MACWLGIVWWWRGADQWDHQATIKRVNTSLIARGHITWFDLTIMKGIYGSPTSTLPATPVVFLQACSLSLLQLGRSLPSSLVR